MAEDAKPLVVGVPKETFPGERRVALIPSMVRSLTKAGLDVIFETGAGLQAGFADEAYTAEGAKTIATRAEVFGAANVVLQVRTCGANATVWNADCELLREGQSLIGLCEPLAEAETMQKAAAKKANIFALELLPRITRAQSMDVLSSMATIAGYKAVLMAAATLPRMFPMLMTAAGTLTPWWEPASRDCSPLPLPKDWEPSFVPTIYGLP